MKRSPGVPVERITVATEKILDRDFSAAISREIRDIGRPLLREVVDEGVRVFERCTRSAKGRDENIGLLFPFLQLIELLDGAEILLDGSSVVGSNPVLRAALEALLTVEWVARDKDLRYGAAYVVSDVHRRIASYRRSLEGHDRRKKLLATIDGDEMLVPVMLPTIPDAEERIAGLQALLTAPHLAAAEAEYQATREKRKKRPRFHALWGGPRNVEELASELGRAAHYEFLYRQWSLTGHADDVLRQLTHVDGVPALRPFRSGEGLAPAYGFAVEFGVIGMRTLLGFYRAEELASSFPTWYKAHIMMPLRRLTPTP